MMQGQEFMSQLTSSAIVLYVLQWLKSSERFPWIDETTTRLNRCLMILGSAVSALGVHIAFDAAKASDGTYILTITGVTLWNVLHGLWHVLNQAAMTQLAYDATLNKPKGEPHA